MKFNPGDRIKCISNKRSYGTSPIIGQIYEVVKSDGNWVYVKWDKNGFENMDFRTEDFELATSARKHKVREMIKLMNEVEKEHPKDFRKALEHFK